MLNLLSGTYKMVIKTRNLCYDHKIFKTHWLLAPTIAIGNITTGGTGKTPTVIKIAQMIENLGYNVGITLRGYGQSTKHPADETLLYLRELPGRIIVANPDRIKGGNDAIKLGAEAIVSDDAYQHRRLGRDINICLVDATFPFGKGRLLPAGRLREPISTLKRTDIIIITKADCITSEKLRNLKSKIFSIVPNAIILLSIHRPKHFSTISADKIPLEYLSDKPASAFAGIGNPEGFIAGLKKLNINIKNFVKFPDHCRYTPRELRKIKSYVNDEYIICTTKDIIKLNEEMLKEANINPDKLLALEMEIEFLENGEEILRSELEKILSEFNTQRIKAICMNR